MVTESKVVRRLVVSSIAWLGVLRWLTAKRQEETDAKCENNKLLRRPKPMRQREIEVFVVRCGIVRAHRGGDKVLAAGRAKRQLTSKRNQQPKGCNDREPNMRSTLGAALPTYDRHENKGNAENRDQNFQELQQIKLGWAASVHT